MPVPSANMDDGREGLEADATVEHPAKMRKLVQVPVLTAKGKYPVKMTSQVTHFKLRGRPMPKRKPRVERNKAAPTPEVAGPTPFDEVIASTHHRYPSLTPVVFSDASAQWGIFERQLTSEYSPVESKTPIRTPRMVVHATHSEPSVVTFKFEVHFVTLSSGLTNDPEFESLLETLLPESKYRVCPGLPEDVTSQLECECSSARRWGFPFHRVDHQDCQLWFPLEREPPRLKRMMTCKNCTHLLYYLRKKNKERLSTSAATLASRIDPSSNYPLKYLSPANRKKRESQKRKRKLQMDRQLQKLRYQQTVNGTAVHMKSMDEVNTLLAETNAHGIGDLVKTSWMEDVQDHTANHGDQRQNDEMEH